LKVERLHGPTFDIRRQAKDEVIDRLLWCERQRLNLMLASVSPMKFEQGWLANQPRQADS